MLLIGIAVQQARQRRGVWHATCGVSDAGNAGLDADNIGPDTVDDRGSARRGFPETPGLYLTEGGYDERKVTIGHERSMGTSSEHQLAHSTYIAAWENLERELAESPIDTEQICEMTLLVLMRWRGSYADLTEGVAEDARSIRSDWARVGEDLRQAIARVGDELRLEGAVV